MASILRPLQKLSKGLTRATDAIMPRAPSYGLLSPQQQAEADQAARIQFLGSILQSAGPSLQPNSGFQALGGAIQQSQEAANKAALAQAQAQMFQQQMGLDQQRLGLQTDQIGLDRENNSAELDEKMLSRLFDLGKQVQSESKDFIEQRNGMARVAAAAEDPTPAGDIALIFGFMKVQDPASTVREGEFATASQAGSVPQRIVALYNSVVSGTRLSDEQRADFLSRSQKLFGAARSDQERRNERFRRRAEDARITRGVDNILIPLDPASGIGPTTAVPNLGGKISPPGAADAVEFEVDLP